MDKQEEVIVYIWARYDHYVIGGRALPSSMERYDVEFGWTASDFEHYQNAGGTWVKFYTIGINALLPRTGQDIPLAVRYNKAPDDPVVERTPLVTGFPADVAILHRLGDKLIDAGLYGICDTIGNAQLSELPSFGSQLVAIDGPLLYFCQLLQVQTAMSLVNLDKGIETGQFLVQPAKSELAKGSVGQQDRLNFLSPRSLSENGVNVLQPRTFQVQGKTFTMAYVNINFPKKLEYGEDPGASQILDDAGKVIASWRLTGKYVVDAIGFPAKLLPQLAEHIA